MHPESTAEPGRRADGMPRLAAMAASTLLLLLIGAVGDRAWLQRQTPPGPAELLADGLLVNEREPGPAELLADGLLVNEREPEPAEPLADGLLVNERERGPIALLPRGPVERGPRVQLGRRLFHDARLSGDGPVSCATGHDLAAGGDDGRPVSSGVRGLHGTRNSPTVLNSRYDFRPFWGGRADTLEEHGRIAGIVSAMKSFSHPGTGAKELVDLNESVRSKLTVARNEWKYVAEAETELDPALPPVPGFRGELNQVILNLVVNAAHAKHGGTLDVRSEVGVGTTFVVRLPLVTTAPVAAPRPAERELAEQMAA